MFVVGVLLRAFLSWAWPGSINPDEAAHFNYAAWIDENGRLPDFAWSTSKAETDSLPYSFENYQQPLYYATAAPLAETGLWAVRGVSVAVFGLSLLLLRPFASNAELAFVWLLPAFVIVSSMATNQAFEFLGATLLALALLSGKWQHLLVASLIFCTSKITGTVVCSAAILYYFAFRGRFLWPLAIGVVSGLWMFSMRSHLASVNQVHQLVSPNFAGSWDRVVQGVCTGTLIPSFESSLVGMTMFAVPILIALVLYMRTKPINSWVSPQAACVLSIVAVWYVFSINHSFSQGRLLYAAIPFILTMGKEHHELNTEA